MFLFGLVSRFSSSCINVILICILWLSVKIDVAFDEERISGGSVGLTDLSCVTTLTST